MKAVSQLALIWLTLAGGVAGAAADGVGLSTLLEARAAANRALNLLLARQRADGSWAGDPASTAQVLIGLANAPEREADVRPVSACANAVAYLRQTAAAQIQAPAGESSAAVLAGLLPGLARMGRTTHQDLLAAGRARLLGLALPVTLSGGSPGLGFARSAGGPADPRLSSLAVDALLVSEGLAPAWEADRYGALANYLREALASALARASPGNGSAAEPGPAAVPVERQVEVALLVRALLCLGASPAERPLADALVRLAVAPPRQASAAFALAEALSLTDGAAAPALSASLRGWPERLVEGLLGTQMGDGGWPAANATESRDLATAWALRTLQVAAGRGLAETPAPGP